MLTGATLTTDDIWEVLKKSITKQINCIECIVDAIVIITGNNIIDFILYNVVRSNVIKPHTSTLIAHTVLPFLS